MYECIMNVYNIVKYIYIFIYLLEQLRYYIILYIIINIHHVARAATARAATRKAGR